MFTDISLCTQTGVAAYAVWAKETGQTFRYSSLFKESFDGHSDYAELAAIINGLFLVIKNIQPPPQSKIIAQSDSAHAIRVLSAKKPKFNDDHKRFLQQRDALLHGKEIEVEYRHVTGHQGYKTRKNAVNTWCDRESRRLVREYRANGRLAKDQNSLLD